MRLSFTTTISLGDEEDIEVEVEYTASGGSPGVYSGPMDGSYPAEPPEVEIGELTRNDTDAKVRWDDLPEPTQSTLEDEAMEDAIENVDNDPFEDLP